MGENKASSLKSGALHRMAPSEGVQYLSSSPFAKPGRMSASNLSVGVDSFTSSEDGQPLEMGVPFSGNTNSSNISSELNIDNVDAVHPMHRKSIEQVQLKILKTKEKIKKEQTAKEDNVNEYLKLSNDADKQQLQRIKAVFEKKNLKSAQLIGQLQRKLEAYNKKTQQLSTPGCHHKPSKGVLKDVGQGLRDFFAREPTRSRDASPSNVASTQASRPIHSKNRTAATLPTTTKNRDGGVGYKGKYGSADNITSNTINICNTRDPHINMDIETGRPIDTNRERSDEDNEESSGLSDSVGSGPMNKPSDTFEASPMHLRHHKHPSNKLMQHELMQQGSPAQQQQQGASDEQQYTGLHKSEVERMKKTLVEFQESRQQVHNSIEAIKNKLEDEGSLFRQALEEERERCERMEDQINDLTELHQNEVFNIKQELMGIQEKMEYQLEERTRDIQELLLACQTKVTKMELQQQQQQIISVESIENSNIRGVITKLINVLLAILAVLLVLVSGIANFTAPFLQTRLRMVTSIVLALMIAVLFNRWPLISFYLDLLNPFQPPSPPLEDELL